MKGEPSPPELIERLARLAAAIAGVEQRKMFGYPALFLNGNMVAGLFGNAVVAASFRGGAAGTHRRWSGGAVRRNGWTCHARVGRRQRATTHRRWNARRVSRSSSPSYVCDAAESQESCSQTYQLTSGGPCDANCRPVTAGNPLAVTALRQACQTNGSSPTQPSQFETHQRPLD